MEMSHLASKLTTLNLEIFEDVIVYLVLISLPASFNQFKVSYNCQKETWSLNELISHYVQEEERLKLEKTESAHLAFTSKSKRKRPQKKKAADKDSQKKQQKDRSTNVENKGCFFCGNPNHRKKQCNNYHAWRAKKGMLLSLVCSEVNLALVPKHTWWIDSGAITHISVSLQGCRKSTDGERYIYVGNDKTVKVQASGKFRLLLKTGFYLDLNETFVVSSFRRNLISVSSLDKFGFSCSFRNRIFSLFHDSKLVGSGSLLLNDNLCTIDSITSYNESLQLSSRGIKRKATNENSASLWHKRLGHISKRRMKRLVSDGSLGPLISQTWMCMLNILKENKPIKGDMMPIGL